MKKANCKKALSTEVNEEILGPYQGSHSDETNGISDRLGLEQGIFNRLEKSGKIKGNTGKLGILYKCYLLF